MRREKIDSNLEMMFLSALIHSKPFLTGAAQIIDDPELLGARPAVQLAEWCLDRFRHLGHPPGPKGVRALFHAWVEQNKPKEEDADALDDLISNLTREGNPIHNAPVLLDELGTFLTLKKVERLRDNLDAALSYGKKDIALQSIQSFRGVDGNEPVGYNPLRGKRHLERAFAEPPAPLVDFPGDAGDFFDPVIVRDSLIGIQGVEKRGKTWWCLEFVYRALRARKRVAMFEVGDLSETQLTKRMAMRVSGVPLWKKQCGGVVLPSKIELVEGDDGKKEPKVTGRTLTFPGPLDLTTAHRAQKKFSRRYRLPHDQVNVMFSVHANNSINVRGIHTVLERWKYENGFVPDLIVIDYADILAPENAREEARHRVNDTWKALRKLSQDWHACVIAPTQANAASYDANTQSMKNFSEDKRKFAHVTGMMGLNQTPSERKAGVMRLNWIVLRESEFDVGRCLWVAQCIPLGMAFVKATM